MKKLTLLCCLLVGFSVVLSYHVDRRRLDLEWKNFKQTYKRQYNDQEEETTRMNAFKRNLQMVEAHNLMYDRGMKSYKMALNKFSDMLPDEIKELNKFRIPTVGKRIESKFVSPLNVDELPKEIDWRAKGLVTKPTDQGACQSCYAFSVVGAIEGQHAKKSGKLIKLSEQNLVDCTTSYGSLGCKGGYLNASFQYVVDFGIDTEDSYPYIGGEQPCKFRNDSIGARITGYKILDDGNEQQILEAVATVGPVSAAIDATLSLLYYSGGIYESSDCSPDRIGHAVLIVGYGSENGKDYWIVKNSIGDLWGEKGYFRLLRNKNMCGIAEYAGYPIV